MNDESRHSHYLFLEMDEEVTGKMLTTWTLHLISKTDEASGRTHREILESGIDDPSRPDMAAIIEKLRDRSITTVFTGAVPTEGFLGFGDLIEHYDCDDASIRCYGPVNHSMIHALSTAGIETVALEPLE